MSNACESQSASGRSGVPQAPEAKTPVPQPAFSPEDCRLAILNLFVTQRQASLQVQTLLTASSDWIVGRFGLPYSKRGLSVICVLLDAPANVISSLSGQIGRIAGVTCQVLYAKPSKGAGGGVDLDG